MDYPVNCSPKNMTRYFHDASSLTIEILDAHRDTQRPVGKTVVELKGVDVTSPLDRTLPVAAANGKVLGHIAVGLHVSYLPVVSSFEMAEHLAATDVTLPLYPITTRRRIVAPPAASVSATLKEEDNETDEASPEQGYYTQLLC